MPGSHVVALAAMFAGATPGTPDPPTSGGSLLAFLSIAVASLGGVAAVIVAKATKGGTAVSGFQALNERVVQERDKYQAASAEKDNVIEAQRDRIYYLEHVLHTQHVDPALWAEDPPAAPTEGRTS